MPDYLESTANAWAAGLPGPSQTHEEEEAVEQDLVPMDEDENEELPVDEESEVAMDEDTFSEPQQDLLGSVESSALMQGTTFDNPSAHATPTQTFPEHFNLRHPHGSESHGKAAELDRKRVAVAGPRQRMLDDIREKREVGRHKVLEQAARLKKQEEEIRALRLQHEEDKQRRLVNIKTEDQMSAQILQYEDQVGKLTEANNRLAQISEQSKTQLDDLTKRCQELSETMVRIMAEHEREKASHENEILSLRSRLQAADQTRASATPPSTVVPTTSNARIANKTRMVRGERSGISIVPLRPANVPAADAGAAPTSNSGTLPGAASSSTPTVPANLDLSNGRTLTAVVKEVIQQINAEVSVQESSPKKNKKRSARSHNQRSIEAQKKKISRANDLKWKEAVRKSWKRHFNILTISDFSMYQPASTEEVNAFETGKEGPDDRNILDFGRGYEKSRWNKVILKRLVQDLREEREADGTWGLCEVDDDYLLALFYFQLKRSRDAWRLVQSRPNLEEGRMETADEVAERVDELSAQRLASVGSRSRRERKHQRRIEIVEKVISFKSAEKAPDLAAWIYFLDLLKRLTVDGMSSEEEGTTQIQDIHVPVFRVKLCIWRNPAIADYFTYIDKEGLNEAIRNSRGSKPHPRIRIDEPGLTPAPKGLPTCLYNSDWLMREEEHKGKQWIEEELCVSEEVYELLKFVAQ
ncbi:hypothetical protein CPC08DRAFT_766063 [Agrocybe pediades]|nr:hypothetical protein CPC08DRAFT_766063 [Agrocybe pediades]